MWISSRRDRRRAAGRARRSPERWLRARDREAPRRGRRARSATRASCRSRVSEFIARASGELSRGPHASAGEDPLPGRTADAPAPTAPRRPRRRRRRTGARRLSRRVVSGRATRTPPFCCLIVASKPDARALRPGIRPLAECYRGNPRAPAASFACPGFLQAPARRARPRSPQRRSAQCPAQRLQRGFARRNTCCAGNRAAADRPAAPSFPFR